MLKQEITTQEVLNYRNLMAENRKPNCRTCKHKELCMQYLDNVGSLSYCSRYEF